MITWSNTKLLKLLMDLVVTFELSGGIFSRVPCRVCGADKFLDIDVGEGVSI